METRAFTGFGPGPLSPLIAWVQNWRESRLASQKQQKALAAIERLGDLSPHYLDDIGVGKASDIDPGPNALAPCVGRT
ncbi:MAG: hypothetical protein KDE08_02635 [Rhodobacteraceae bacterium]|nr:hypothetical protein [Paracoccaceae bacterium]